MLNDPNDKNHVSGGRIVAAFKGDSKDIPTSADRVDKFTQELKEKYGVKIVDSIEELCQQMACILPESVDSCPHLAQAKPVFKAIILLVYPNPSL